MQKGNFASPRLGEGARRAGEVRTPPLRKGRLGGVVVIVLGVLAEQCLKGGRGLSFVDRRPSRARICDRSYKILGYLFKYLRPLGCSSILNSQFSIITKAVAETHWQPLLF